MKALSQASRYTHTHLLLALLLFMDTARDNAPLPGYLSLREMALGTERSERHLESAWVFVTMKITPWCHGHGDSS